MNEVATGGCLCGAVRYEIAGGVGPAGYCHCSDCRRVTGGAFHVGARAAAKDFRVTAGAPAAYTKTSDRGVALTRHFCVGCGSPLFTTSASHAETIFVKAGSLDDPTLVKPAYEIWTASRVSWSRIPDGLPAFEKNRS
jgi:hypothetical protein